MNNVLLDKVNIDTNGTYIASNGSEKQLIAEADSFGGGTVNIETSIDGNISIPVTINGFPGTPISFTTNGSVKIFIGQGAKIRATLTGSSGASNVRVILF